VIPFAGIVSEGVAPGYAEVALQATDIALGQALGRFNG